MLLSPAVNHPNQTSSRVAAVFFATVITLVSPHSKAQQPERVATLKQWPGVSQLIAYRDRIWFVNSQPFEDNNSADIYSYSIKERSLRYERSLFSQDVGNPVVYNGLLHWPFEDPRRSAGSGEFAVTDGTRWQWRAMASGSVMHVHAMNVCQGDLVAATGSWTGQLHRRTENDDWQVQYDYPAAPSSFSRIVSVVPWADNCIVGTSANGKTEAKLFALRGSSRIPLDGWPTSDRTDQLTLHQQALFAFVDTGNSRQLIRYDGTDPKTLSLPDGLRPRAMHSDGSTLWLIAHNPNAGNQAGSLWKYGTSNKFNLVSEFSSIPIALTSLNSTIAIGTYSQSGGGLLLYKGEQTATVGTDTEVRALPVDEQSPSIESTAVDALYSELLDLIADPDNTANYARTLRQRIGRHPAIQSSAFGAALTRALSLPIEGTPATMFTGQSIPRQDLIRWYLITTLAINGNGRIDPSWINVETDLTVPDSGKVFDPAIASIVASGWLQQDDKETLAALFTRLNRQADPQWVKADIIGALTAITDQRLGYDVAGWNKWWAENKDTRFH